MHWASRVRRALRLHPRLRERERVQRALEPREARSDDGRQRRQSIAFLYVARREAAVVVERYLPLLIDLRCTTLR